MVTKGTILVDKDDLKTRRFLEIIILKIHFQHPPGFWHI